MSPFQYALAALELGNDHCLLVVPYSKRSFAPHSSLSTLLPTSPPIQLFGWRQNPQLPPPSTYPPHLFSHHSSKVNSPRIHNGRLVPSRAKCDFLILEENPCVFHVRSTEVSRWENLRTGSALAASSAGYLSTYSSGRAGP